MIDYPELSDVIRLDLDEESFNNAALELFHLQARFNYPYRQYIKGLGVDPASIIDWTEIPPVPVSAFRDQRVTCFPPIETCKVFHTSGTTGTQTGKHEFASMDAYERSLQLWFEECLPYVARHQWISLIPSGDLLPHSSLSHMITTLDKSVARNPVDYVCNSEYQFDPAVVFSLIINRAESGVPLLLLGTSFAFVRLLESMMESRIRTELPLGSLIFDTGGTKGRCREVTSEVMLEMVEECLGIQPEAVWNEYGMTECSSQAYASMNVQLHRFPPWARYTIRNPATGDICQPGEKGLVQILDLANQGSVLSLATMDAGIYHRRGLELCGRIQTDDLRGCSLNYE